MWQEVASENTHEICRHITQKFVKSGPHEEVQMDKNTLFAAHYNDFCRERNATQKF